MSEQPTGSGADGSPQERAEETTQERNEETATGRAAEKTPPVGTAPEQAAGLVTRILELSGLELTAVASADTEPARVRLEGPDLWATSGRFAETTSALQHLVGRMLDHEGDGSNGPLIESGSRSADRDARLSGLAASLAALASTGRGHTVAIDLMEQADRKALHAGLQAGGLESFSSGDGAYRRLVVRPAGRGGVRRGGRRGEGQRSDGQAG